MSKTAAPGLSLREGTIRGLRYGTGRPLVTLFTSHVGMAG